MTKKLKKILSRASKRHKHTLQPEDRATYEQRLAGLSFRKKTSEKKSLAPMHRAHNTPLHAYPVKKDMILFETLNNIHALFSIPQKN